jgi:hypothetical protein
LDGNKQKAQYILELVNQLGENSEPSDENSDDEQIKMQAKFKRHKMKVKKNEE